MAPIPMSYAHFLSSSCGRSSSFTCTQRKLVNENLKLSDMTIIQINLLSYTAGKFL